MNIEKEKMHVARLVFRAADNKLRIKILDFIDKNQPVKVTRIYKALKMEQATTSSHLKILRDAELVRTKRNGKKIFYSIDKGSLRNLRNAVNIIC